MLLDTLEIVISHPEFLALAHKEQSDFYWRLAKFDTRYLKYVIRMEAARDKSPELIQKIYFRFIEERVYQYRVISFREMRRYVNQANDSLSREQLENFEDTLKN